MEVTEDQSREISRILSLQNADDKTKFLMLSNLQARINQSKAEDRNRINRKLFSDVETSHIDSGETRQRTGDLKSRIIRRKSRKSKERKKTTEKRVHTHSFIQATPEPQITKIERWYRGTGGAHSHGGRCNCCSPQ
jgi:hypothetical protein